MKKLSCMGEKVVFGCTNGCVFSMNQFKQTTQLTSLMSEITYLECFDDGVIIDSCNASFKIVGNEQEFNGKVSKAFRYRTNQLLLVKKNCAIEVIDTRSGEIATSKLLVKDATCTAQAYYDSLVVIRTLNHVHIWKVDEDPDAINEPKTMESPTAGVTCVAISPDKNVLAVGCSNGTIEVCLNIQKYQKLFSFPPDY